LKVRGGLRCFTWYKSIAYADTIVRSTLLSGMKTLHWMCGKTIVIRLELKTTALEKVG